MEFIEILIVLVVFGLFILFSTVKVLREYDRGVIFRLGRLIGFKGPGLIILIPFIDKMVKVSLRTITMDVEPQDVITRDNVSIKVNAVLYFRVIYPDKAIVSVENYLYATNQIAQTTLRSILGQSDLDEILSEREKINIRLQQIIDEHTEPWGIKVASVEVKQIDLPLEMQRAMAKQAQAERERRAKVINADGEFQASIKLSEAAEQLMKFPVTIQLRFLQTLSDIATEKNSTIIFPVPIDIIKPFLDSTNLTTFEKLDELKETLANFNRKE
ncbi:MAG TPA: slipin family protein [Candidatus Kapabacteria bacterium]|nr:slipin family protein [Candidatus Kapabacteria bacterium]